MNRLNFFCNLVESNAKCTKDFVRDRVSRFWNICNLGSQLHIVIIHGKSMRREHV
jgi:hypothetical protein